MIAVPKQDRDQPRYRTAFRKLGLGRGEQLDALALAKRLAGRAEQFTAYSRIAADPWIESLTTDQQRRLSEAYRPLVQCELATGVSGNGATYRALPYDAQLVYDFRLANALAGRDLDDKDKKALCDLQQVIKALADGKNGNGQAAGTPVPYAVILKADGDRMGKLLAQARSAEDSRRISRDLHGFASGVRQIVQTHRGHAIYSGGDDVLALLPLDCAVDCADALRYAFARVMAKPAEALGLEPSAWPTLSVGLGIGHVMEPLGTLRARAEWAEKLAKGNDLPTKDEQRNALAIVLGIRSGADYPWRARWDDRDAFEALRQFTQAYRDDRLPGRIAYDLRDIDRRLAWLDTWKDTDDDRQTREATAQGMRGSEVQRMLDRARNAAGVKEIPKDLCQLIVTRAKAQLLNELADSLIIARWLSARTAAEVGDPQ